MREFTKGEKILIAYTVIMEVVMTLILGVDSTLSNGTVIAYGIPWYFFNPLYWTGMTYKLIMLNVVLWAVLGQLWLVKHGKLDFDIFIMGQLMQMFNIGNVWFQNVTPTILLPLVTINPIFNLFFFLQKFPIGFAPGSSQWQCAFYYICGTPGSGTRFDFFNSPTTPQAFRYVAVLIFIVYLNYRWLKKWRQRKR